MRNKVNRKISQTEITNKVRQVYQEMFFDWFSISNIKVSLVAQWLEQMTLNQQIANSNRYCVICGEVLDNIPFITAPSSNSPGALGLNPEQIHKKLKISG